MILLSCKSRPQTTAETVGKQHAIENITKYVTCPSDTIELMLASADSICALTENSSLEYLELDTENECIKTLLDSLSNNEITTIVQVYATYDVVTNCSTNEANAAFAWHEIAKQQIAKFRGKNVVSYEEADSFFTTVRDILSYYGAGTQYDMNISAWRSVMIADFQLISAYKELYDSFNEPSLLPYIHKSYQNLLAAYRNRCSQVEGSWSDLPRELACMQIAMMEGRRQAIEKLLLQNQQKSVTIQDIKAKLGNEVDDEKWEICDF